MSYILVLYYSRTGSVAKLAQEVALGVEKINGIEARIRTVPSVSPRSEKTEDSIPPEGPPYATLDDLKNCAGLVMGSPTRFGNMAAPLKHFLDTTGGMWQSGALVDKPVGFFTSTSSMHGGQESTLLSMMLPCIHHGMIVVGVPYTQIALNKTRTGGTPYGPSHFAGPNNDQPISEEEKIICHTLGERVAKFATSLKK